MKKDETELPRRSQRKRTPVECLELTTKGKEYNNIREQNHLAMQRKSDIELSEDMCCVMAKIMNEFEHRGEKAVLEKAFTQYTLSKAEKKFGKKGLMLDSKSLINCIRGQCSNLKRCLSYLKKRKRKCLNPSFYQGEERWYA